MREPSAGRDAVRGTDRVGSLLREPPITQRREELTPNDRSGLGGVDLASGRERTPADGALRVGGL